jgi:hypothetical protein
MTQVQNTTARADTKRPTLHTRVWFPDTPNGPLPRNGSIPRGADPPSRAPVHMGPNGGNQVTARCQARCTRCWRQHRRGASPALPPSTLPLTGQTRAGLVRASQTPLFAHTPVRLTKFRPFRLKCASAAARRARRQPARCRACAVQDEDIDTARPFSLRPSTRYAVARAKWALLGFGFFGFFCPLVNGRQGLPPSRGGSKGALALAARGALTHVAPASRGLVSRVARIFT